MNLQRKETCLPFSRRGRATIANPSFPWGQFLWKSSLQPSLTKILWDHFKRTPKFCWKNINRNNFQWLNSNLNWSTDKRLSCKTSWVRLEFRQLSNLSPSQCLLLVKFTKFRTKRRQLQNQSSKWKRHKYKKQIFRWVMLFKMHYLSSKLAKTKRTKSLRAFHSQSSEQTLFRYLIQTPWWTP